MDPHFTREYVWLVQTDHSFDLDATKLHSLGISGIYFNAADPTAPSRSRTYRAMGFVTGIFYPASTEFQFGHEVAQKINAYRLTNLVGDGGQTAILLDFEPSHGSVEFWNDFITTYRALMPGRVTDFTPEPFKASELPVQNILNARFDVKVQNYFGDMSPVDAYEAGLDWIRAGYPSEQIRGFVDGGRKNKPPIFYEGRVVRSLMKGTAIWSANLLREAGLI